MIDITVDNNEVEVEQKKYHSFNDKNELARLIEDIVNKCLYSGESITLWIAKGEIKNLSQEWVNPHVSSYYMKIKEESK